MSGVEITECLSFVLRLELRFAHRIWQIHTKTSCGEYAPRNATEAQVNTSAPPPNRPKTLLKRPEKPGLRYGGALQCDAPARYDAPALGAEDPRDGGEGAARAGRPGAAGTTADAAPTRAGQTLAQ